jgi:hypothetical protein
VGVLSGGLSVEREVSLRSGAAISEALRSLGYRVVDVDVQRDVALRLLDMSIDVAFIALHGRYGEDGSIQGLLESMHIPYTGSGRPGLGGRHGQGLQQAGLPGPRHPHAPLPFLRHPGGRAGRPGRVALLLSRWW